jgi:hypothetical protein
MILKRLVAHQAANIGVDDLKPARIQLPGTPRLIKIGEMREQVFVTFKRRVAPQAGMVEVDEFGLGMARYVEVLEQVCTVFKRLAAREAGMAGVVWLARVHVSGMARGIDVME